VALAGVIQVLVIARWARPEGGYCFGPRLLLPVVPLLLTPLAFVERAGGRRLLRLGVVLGLVGAFINLPGVVTPFPYVAQTAADSYYSREMNGYDLEFSPWAAVGGWARRAGAQLALEGLVRPPAAARASRGMLAGAWPLEPDLLFVHLYRDRWPVPVWAAPLLLAGVLLVAGLLRFRASGSGG